MKGNCGFVNGVVMPACSIHTKPYPLRITVLLNTRYAKPTRGPKFNLCSSRDERGKPSRPRYWSFCVSRFNTAP